MFYNYTCYIQLRITSRIRFELIMIYSVVLSLCCEWGDDCNFDCVQCRNKGIYFVAIDQTRPLSDQGPFDIVLHKVSAAYSSILV